ncbi:aspartyl protease family protein [Massilia niabensis]|uniref:Aspartyl protease family protein n=1 Tax=Massilia niabensis TaxID=544910 RepID=A0ABW0L4B3_9BURK
MTRPHANRARPSAFLPAMLFFWSGCALAQTGLEPGCVIGQPIVLPITFAYADERPTIPGTIAGHPASVLVDTASSVSMLYRPALEKLGVKVRSSETNYPGQDILIANIPSLTVGPVSLKGYFTVLESKDDIAMRLGANYLARSDHEIWWAGKQIQFTSPKGCRKSFLAAWDPAAHVVPFETDQLKKDMRAWFKVKVNGRDVDTILDTNFPVSLMDLHTAARFGITPESPGAVEEDAIVSWRDKAQRVWRVPVANMSIGSYHVQNATIRIMDLTLSGEMMTLGADFLRNHRVLVSMSQKRLYISHLGGPSFSTPLSEPEAQATRCTTRECVTAP